MKYYLKKKKQNIGNKIYSIYIFKGRKRRNEHEQKVQKQRLREKKDS